MKNLRETFAGRRVLITGDTGFKGSWLSLWLSDLGAETFGFALPPEGETPLFDALGIGELITHHDGDIRDYADFESVMKKVAPELVIHLAAQSLVMRAYKEPKLTIDTNVGGSLNLLEAVRHCDSVKALVFITSDKCYRNKEWVWGYRENDELGGADPYSASKAAAENIFATFQDSFFSDRPGFGAASARAGNVIGGGDWSENRIIPDISRALTSNHPIILRSPNATRPWQHVLEPLSGYLFVARDLLNGGSAGESYNFGPDTNSVMTVKELADEAVRLWGAGEVIAEAPKNAFHEANLLQLNTDKAKINLNWLPVWGVQRSVNETVAWYRDVYAGDTPLSVTRAQIKAFMKDGEL